MNDFTNINCILLVDPNVTDVPKQMYKLMDKFNRHHIYYQIGIMDDIEPHRPIIGCVFRFVHTSYRIGIFTLEAKNNLERYDSLTFQTCISATAPGASLIINSLIKDGVIG